MAIHRISTLCTTHLRYIQNGTLDSIKRLNEKVSSVFWKCVDIIKKFFSSLIPTLRKPQPLTPQFPLVDKTKENTLKEIAELQAKQQMRSNNPFSSLPPEEVSKKTTTDTSSSESTAEQQPKPETPVQNLTQATTESISESNLKKNIPPSSKSPHPKHMSLSVNPNKASNKPLNLTTPIQIPPPGHFTPPSDTPSIPLPQLLEKTLKVEDLQKRYTTAQKLLEDQLRSQDSELTQNQESRNKGIPSNFCNASTKIAVIFQYKNASNYVTGRYNNNENDLKKLQNRALPKLEKLIIHVSRLADLEASFSITTIALTHIRTHETKLATPPPASGETIGSQISIQSRTIKFQENNSFDVKPEDIMDERKDWETKKSVMAIIGKILSAVDQKDEIEDFLYKKVKAPT